jgi:hypothetical protein
MQCVVRGFLRLKVLCTQRVAVPPINSRLPLFCCCAHGRSLLLPAPTDRGRRPAARPYTWHSPALPLAMLLHPGVEWDAQQMGMETASVASGDLVAGGQAIQQGESEWAVCKRP